MNFASTLQLLTTDSSSYNLLGCCVCHIILFTAIAFHQVVKCILCFSIADYQWGNCVPLQSPLFRNSSCGQWVANGGTEMAGAKLAKCLLKLHCQFIWDNDAWDIDINMSQVHSSSTLMGAGRCFNLGGHM